MGMIRTFIENFKHDWAQAAEKICDRVAVIDGERYAVFYKRTFFRNRINKNRIRLMTKLPAALTASGSNDGNMTYEEAMDAMRVSGARQRPVGRPNPLDKLKF
jgi:hypothetical protein